MDFLSDPTQSTQLISALIMPYCFFAFGAVLDIFFSTLLAAFTRSFVSTARELESGAFYS